MEKYSVLMSVYHKENPEYFKLAVESMLEQTIKPDDFVLVCDGPLTDELNKEIEVFDNQNKGLFQIIRIEKNMGLANALNTGIEYCKNELVARMDTDDIALNDRIEKQIKVFEENSSVAIVGGQIAEFETNPSDITAYRIVPCEHNEILKRMKNRNPLNHMTVMYKKSVVLSAGGYPLIDLFEDYALWATIAANGYRITNIEDVAVYMRTGYGMYGRRGGIKYLKSIRRMEKLLFETKIITYTEFLKNIAVRYLGAVMPTRLRQIAYSVFLRKR